MNEILSKFLDIDIFFYRDSRYIYWDSRYTYQNEIDKACFQHDMAYGDLKDLNRRTFADKVLRDKAFNIAKDPEYDGCGLSSVIYEFFDKNLKN